MSHVAIMGVLEKSLFVQEALRRGLTILLLVELSQSVCGFHSRVWSVFYRGPHALQGFEEGPSPRYVRCTVCEVQV